MAFSLGLMRTKNQIIADIERAIEERLLFAYTSSVALGVVLEPRHLYTVEAIDNQYGPAWAVVIRSCETGDEFKRGWDNFNTRFMQVSA